MIVLGIETSCDETAAAVVKDGTEILANVIASSAELHEKTGGVIPEQAARKQLESIQPVIKLALGEAKMKSADLDALAVTVGPGLIGSLLVGVETAKTLSLAWDKPLIPVNHLVGHVYANWLKSDREEINKPIRFPVLVLIVSGGHTDLVLMKSHGKFDWLGGTRDDAAGEAFDKTARLLGLPYPGGPAVASAAKVYFERSKSTVRLTLFPRPLIASKDFDWSFSGLKTAVANEVQRGKLTSKDVSRLAAETQEAIVDVLVAKTLKAVEKYRPTSLLLSGGVAANSRLKEKFQSEIRHLKSKIQFFVPPPKFCTDNAAMIAAAAFFAGKSINWRKIAANPSLTVTQKPF